MALTKTPLGFVMAAVNDATNDTNGTTHAACTFSRVEIINTSGAAATAVLDEIGAPGNTITYEIPANSVHTIGNDGQRVRFANGFELTTLDAGLTVHCHH